MDVQRLENLCQELEIPHCRFFDQVGSTNDVAMGWINEDYQEYALAIAGSQTKGRGRYDRQWITTPGASIAMSFIIHPTLPEREQLGLFPLLSGLALCMALESAYPLSPQVKWPNDILLAGKRPPASWLNLSGSEM